MAGFPHPAWTDCRERGGHRAAALRAARVVLAVRAHEVERGRVWLTERAIQRQSEQFEVVDELAPAQRPCLLARIDDRPPPVRTMPATSRTADGLDAHALSPGPRFDRHRQLRVEA